MILPLLLTSLFCIDALQDYPTFEFVDQQNENLSQLFDMDDFLSDAILETRQIVFPAFPDAFNPSIVRWQGRILMSFRCYDPITRATNPFALVFLNEQFEPISEPQVFEIPFHNPVLRSKQQDPRLIPVGDRLFVVYNNILEEVTDREMRRMVVSELFFDGDQFSAGTPEYVKNYPGKNDQRYEKNWVPFDHNGKLMFAYSISPHRIFRPLLGTETCELVSSTSTNFQWDWGMLCGGTQAFLDNGQYLAFFHSWTNLPSVQSGGKKICHYVMGAYTFQAEPPFAITSISPVPMTAENFYRPPYHKTWKPMRCIFPGGLIIDEDYLWIAYGRQDHEIWIAKLDKKKLYESLVPVPRRKKT